MKSFFALTFLTLSLSSTAFADAYRCSLVNGEPELTVEVNLESKMAAFFDNDAWYKIPQTDDVTIETYPSTEAFTFEGKEAGGQPMTLHFELFYGILTTPTGDLQLSGGTFPENYDLECTKVNASELWSGI